MNVVQWARGQWDRVSAWILISLGGLAVVLGWLGVRTEALTQKQIPYIISGGIGGLLLVAVGAMLWLSADLRDEWRKLDRIEHALGEGVLKWADDSAGGSHRAKSASNSAAPAAAADKAGLAHAASSREHA